MENFKNFSNSSRVKKSGSNSKTMGIVSLIHVRAKTINGETMAYITSEEHSKFTMNSLAGLSYVARGGGIEL